MLSKEDFMVIQALVRRGVYQRDIAARLGVHPRTVRRAVRRNGPPGGRRRRRRSKLDPYKGRIDELLGENVWNAVVILREIQAQGYSGGISILARRPRRRLRDAQI